MKFFFQSLNRFISLFLKRTQDRFYWHCMRLLLLFCLLVNLFLLSSCKKYQPANSSFFIKSDVISVTTATAQGSGSHKITDLWIYTNGKFQGSYPVGNLMPIVNKGENATINIRPGIKNNGISNTRVFYPFFEIFELDTLVSTGKTISRSFTFKYDPNTKFRWIEDFEYPVGFALKGSSLNEATLQYCGQNDRFEGKSFVATLSGLNKYGQIESTGAGYELIAGSSDIYLELNYKSNVAFTVGVMDVRTDESADAVVVNPQAEWNKIYIQLSNAVGTLNATKYKVFFKFVKTDDADKEVFLDNIKLLTF